MSDYDQPMSAAKVLMLLGSTIGLCVGVTIFIQQMTIEEVHDRISTRDQAQLELRTQFESRFVSDVDQLDKRIGNNAGNIRTLIRMVPGASLRLPQEDETAE